MVKHVIIMIVLLLMVSANTVAQELVVICDSESTEVLQGLKETYKKEFQVVVGRSPEDIADLLREVKPDVVLAVGHKSLDAVERSGSKARCVSAAYHKNRQAGRQAGRILLRVLAEAPAP